MLLDKVEKEFEIKDFNKKYPELVKELEKAEPIYIDPYVSEDTRQRIDKVLWKKLLVKDVIDKLPQEHKDKILEIPEVVSYVNAYKKALKAFFINGIAVSIAMISYIVNYCYFL